VETGLSGRTVVVTGGNANIGRGIAVAFAAERCRVVIVGRDEAQGRRVLDQLIDKGAKDVLWYAADVTDRQQVVDMVGAVREHFGRVDVLVNNVGGNVDVDPFVDSDPDTWDRDIALNVISTLNCAHAVLPGMIEQARGRIINIGSVSGIVGDPNLAVYSAMKGAVHTFTKVLAKEVGKHGITVNAIAPYGTLPEDPERDVSRGSRFHPEGLYAQLFVTKAELFGAMGRATVLERNLAKPSEIGAAAVYLASDGAEFVTGHILCVDGGTLIA
jgi:2-hydroxycyclohexanecarboxyl-CoA dehydrogenase